MQDGVMISLTYRASIAETPTTAILSQARITETGFLHELHLLLEWLLPEAATFTNDSSSLCRKRRIFDQTGAEFAALQRL